MSPDSIHAARQPETPGRLRCPLHGFLLDDRGGCVRCGAEVLKTGGRRILRTIGAVAAMVVTMLGGTIIYRAARATNAVCSAHASSQAVRIVVFGANWCGSCRAARAWLEKEGYAYEWHDVDDPATGRLLQAEAKIPPGRTAIPVIGVDGDYSSGFNPRGLQRRIQEEQERCKTASAQ